MDRPRPERQERIRLSDRQIGTRRVHRTPAAGGTARLAPILLSLSFNSNVFHPTTTHDDAAVGAASRLAHHRPLLRSSSASAAATSPSAPPTPDSHTDAEAAGAGWRPNVDSPVGLFNWAWQTCGTQLRPTQCFRKMGGAWVSKSGCLLMSKQWDLRYRNTSTHTPSSPLQSTLNCSSFTTWRWGSKVANSTNAPCFR